MEQLKKIFITAGLSEPDVETVLEKVEEKNYFKNHYLLHAGSTATRLYFVATGSVLLGQEMENTTVTRHIALAGEFITCLKSFQTASPTPEFLKTTTASRIYEIKKPDFDRAVTQFPVLQQFYQRFIMHILFKCQQRIADLTGMDARSYYEKVLQEQPELFQYVPQYELASYLGIEPQSLSRLRTGKKIG